MRILEVVVRFRPYVGGVENTVYELGTRFVRRGHKVTVVCAAEPSGPPVVDGVEAIRLPYRGKIGNTNLAVGLLKTLRAQEANVIHAHMPTAWFADAAAMASVELKVPFVLTYNNDLMGQGGKGFLATIYNRFLLPRLLTRTTRIVVPNPSYPEYSPYLGSFRDRIIYIPWGVDERRYSPAPLDSHGTLTVCFLSLLDRHHDYKGLQELLLSTSELCRKGLQLRLRIAGAGDKLHHYQSMANALGITEQVEFLGFVGDDELDNFFHSGDLFALPSKDFRQEGFGLVLLEAMASGRPVLTTTIVGMAHDIARHDTGFLVPPGDQVALTQALESAYHSRERLFSMAENARRMVTRNYTWDTVVQSYEDLFTSLVR